MNIPRNVLFLDTAESGLGAEAAALLQSLGGGHFRGYNADPQTWDAFAGEGSSPLDVVITLSNSVVGEVCAVFWTGRPITTHWPLPDEPEAARARLAARILEFVGLPFAELDPLTLQARLDKIGRNS